MSAIDIAVAAKLRNGQTQSASQVQALDRPTGVASPIDFYRFDLVELKGRFLHEGFFPIPGDPLPGTAIGQAVLLGPWESAQFRLVTEADDSIKDIDLKLENDETEGTTLTGTFDVPNQPFKVAVSGIDRDGLAYDITRTQVFRPQTVEIRFSPEFQLVSPGVALLHADITNQGPLDTFQISVEDDKDVGVSSSVPEIELAQDESGSVEFSLQVPAISSGILNITVTATVTGVNNSAVQNSGTTLARLEKFNLLQMDGFESGAEQEGGGDP